VSAAFSSCAVNAPEILLGSLDAQAASTCDVVVILESKLSCVGVPRLS